MPGGVDVSGFLTQQIKTAKKRYEKALANGDYETAALQAKRIAELLRELARVRKWGQKGLRELASEYEEIARKLEGKKKPRKILEAGSRRSFPKTGAPPSTRAAAEGEPASTGGEEGLDEEFDRQAETLISKADITWDDIAGLEDVKKSLIEALFYSLARPSDPRVKVEPPRRFLLYGPPGTGKTMLAMAASNMLGATFIYVSVDRILSRYVGDAPRMISAIFRLARRKAPSIVFFDEVETLMMKRDSGKEAATGLVQTLLTELDGFKSKRMEKPVIVMAATNKPWLLDEAILSRFEKRIYVPLPDLEAREAIFRLNLEKKGFQIEGITYRELAEMTEGYSGRDIANACREAIMMMLRRANPDVYKIMEKPLMPGRLQELKYRVVPIRREELVEAIRKVKPPVTRDLIKKYEEWSKGSS